MQSLSTDCILPNHLVLIIVTHCHHCIVSHCHVPQSSAAILLTNPNLEVGEYSVCVYVYVRIAML